MNLTTCWGRAALGAALLFVGLASAAAPLVISQAPGDQGVLVTVAGPGAEAYDLRLEPDGSLLLRFPGAALSLAEPPADGPVIAASISSGDTLVIPPGSTLVGVEAAPGSLRLTLAAGPGAGLQQTAYRLGVGDKIRLDIYGEEQFQAREMRVVDDGTVSVPYLGEARVAGLTVTEVADNLTRRLAAGYLRDPKVSVEVVEYQSQWVNVSGQVEKPGRYYLEGPTRLVDIIARAGGLKKEAGTEIRLTRPAAGGDNDQTWSFSRESLYLSDDPESNPVLRSGDSVIVSSEEYFYIKGEVKSPGRYALDRDTTLLKAISLAGGLEQYANQKKIEVLRKQGDETIRMVLNVERIENQKAEDIRILPGDIINVKARFL